MALTNPTPEEAMALFKEIEQKFPSATLGEDKWEILAVQIPSVHASESILILPDLCDSGWWTSSFLGRIIQISHLETTVQHTRST